MTLEEIVKLSGIEDYPNYLTYDYAVPIGIDGKYPHDGKAITIYFRDGSMEIVSYKSLMQLARKELKGLLRPINFRQLNHPQLFKYFQAYMAISDELIDSSFTETFDFEYIYNKLNVK